MNTKDFKNPVLFFSGGRDSMAMLFMLREQLSDIFVLWSHTESVFPETQVMIDYARKMCPNWIEISTNKKGDWDVNGLPSDLIPTTSTAIGHLTAPSKSTVRMQPSFNCCMTNIVMPMRIAADKLGSTLWIQGQKSSDTQKSTSQTGTKIGNVTFYHPLEKFTDLQIVEYLVNQMGDDFPDHFLHAHSSLDCMDCTAYLDSAIYSRELLKQYPDEHKAFKDNINKIRQALAPQLEALTLTQGVTDGE